MDRIQPVNISAFIIPPSHLHTDCRPVRGMGLVQPIVAETSWVGGKILISICRMAEWSQEGKSHSWRSVGWKTYCLGTTEFRLCFPGAWVVMTWLCPCWIVDLYSVWISWWLHCEGPHSLRSVYPAAGASPELPCSGAGHSTMDCRKEKTNELNKNKAKKKSCWKCCVCYGMALCLRGLIPWVLLLGSAYSGALHYLSRKKSSWWPQKMCYCFALQWFSRF